MSFKYLRELPSPEEIRKEYALGEKLDAIKKQRDKDRNSVRKV